MALTLKIEPKKGISLWSEYTTKSLSASRGYDALLNTRTIMAKVKHQNSRVHGFDEYWTRVWMGLTD